MTKPDIFIFGEITMDTAKEIIPLMLTKPLRSKHIWLGSEGGDIESAFCIAAAMDYLRRYGHEVTIHAAGGVQSSAAYLFQCADRRTITPHTTMMIHKVFTEFAVEKTERFTEEDFVKNLRANQVYTDHMIEAICRRSGLHIDTIHERLKQDQDWFLSADEIISFNLADEVIPYADFIQIETKAACDGPGDGSGIPSNVVTLTSSPRRGSTRRRAPARKTA